MKHKYADYITLAQSHARHGKTTIEIAHVLVNALQERYEGRGFMPILIFCLSAAFDIPFPAGLSIQHWTGVFEEGTVTDDELAATLTPYIEAYLHSLPPE